MEVSNVFVGLDDHQASVQVCVIEQRGEVLLNKSGPNDAGAIIAAVQRQGDVGGVAIESCSGAADLGEELIARAGRSVDLAHPGFVNRMTQNPDKGDFTGAVLPADLSDPRGKRVRQAGGTGASDLV